MDGDRLTRPVLALAAGLLTLAMLGVEARAIAAFLWAVASVAVLISLAVAIRRRR